MNILFLDCSMGASGDMLTAALAQLLPDPQRFLSHINSINMRPTPLLQLIPTTSHGISGIHAKLSFDGTSESPNFSHSHSHDHSHHAHSHEHISDVAVHSNHKNDPASINALIESLELPQPVKDNAQSVYRLIADAESLVHNVSIDRIHFHELGELDAVFDIVAVSLLIHLIAPDKIIASPINLGSGSVRSAHGILPVPAPATAQLLKNIPAYGSDINAELCTPTGAALLSFFVDSYSHFPLITTSAIGYGIGTLSFPSHPNCLRAFLGHTESDDSDIVSELSCNIDDMSGEALAMSAELLRSNGALDVFFIPAQGKKNRPVQLLVCLCKPDDEAKLAELILKHTTTFGVRRSSYSRYTLSRDIRPLITPLGTVNIKYGEGYGISKFKPEYADLERISREFSIPLDSVYRQVIKALS